MAILATDITTRLSGGAGNADPNASIGGAMSNTAFADNVANNLFDDVSGAEASAGDIEYRCFYVRNGHATLPWLAPKIWLSTLTTSADTEFDIGLATEGVSAAAAAIANEGTAPAGVTFSRPTTKGAGLSFPDIPAGGYHGVWIRRTVNASAAAANDSGAFTIEGESAP